MAGWNTTDIDWTSAATIEPTLASQPYLVLYNIAEALRERSATVMTPDTPNVLQRGDPRGIVLDLDASYESIYGQFVNHTDNSGVWNDTASPAPVWTEAALETATGLSRPASPVRGDLLSSDWVFWMYSAINLLLWALDTTTRDSSTRFKPEVNDADWSTAVAKLAAASWSSWSAYASTGGASHTAQLSSGKYYIDRGAVRLDTIVVPTADNYKLDVYTQFQKNSTYTYENNDYAVSEGNFYRVFTDATSRSGNVAAGTVTVGNIDTNSMSQPTTSILNWICYGGRSVGKWRLLRKYDMTGGFDYVAP